MEDGRNAPEGPNFPISHTTPLTNQAENREVGALGFAPEEPLDISQQPLFAAQRQALGDVLQKLEEHASQGNKGKLIIPVVELPKSGAKQMLLAGEERFREAGGNIRTYKSYNTSGIDRISGSYYKGPWPIILHMTTDQLEEYSRVNKDHVFYAEKVASIYGNDDSTRNG